MRSASSRPCGRAAPSSSSSDSGRSSSTTASSSACSSRSATGSSRSIAACASRLSSRKRRHSRCAPSAAADVDPGRERAPALARSPRRRRRAPRAGASCRSSGRGITIGRLVCEQQLLEHDAERVRLAGAGLAAEERVAVEAAGVERERHARRQPQLADRQPRAPAAALAQPRGDLLRRRRADRRRRGTARRRRTGSRPRRARRGSRACCGPPARRRSPPTPPRRRRRARARIDSTCPSRGRSPLSSIA